jgi:NAD(P)-dependent dehydrogenase (short-subunit alcohol dehydrogenase family)
MHSDSSSGGIREAWNKSYSLNVTSTQVVTHQFMALLLKSSDPRLIFITSGLSSLTTTSGGFVSKVMVSSPAKGWPKPPSMSQVAYRSSKSALNMMMLDWVQLLEPDGVRVFCISPGFLATNLGGLGPEMLKKFGAGDPGVGGVFIKDVVEGKRDNDAGKVLSKDGVQPW